MLNMTITTRGFSGGSAGKEPANAGDLRDVGLIPGLERSPGGGNGSPLWYSCLGTLMHRGAWWAPVLGFPKRQPSLTAHDTQVTLRVTLHEHTFSQQTWHRIINGVTVG